VLSALVAVIAHGEALIDAATEGSAGVFDFFHEAAVTAAREAGEPEPLRGQTQSVAAPVTAAAQVIDYAQLAKAIVAAQASASVETKAAEPAADVTAAETTGSVFGTGL
jgi:hypothetical protein